MYSAVKSLLILAYDEYSSHKGSLSDSEGHFPKGSLNHWRVIHRLKNMAISQRALTPIKEAVSSPIYNEHEHEDQGDAELMV
jgi:hypothetical protein